MTELPMDCCAQSRDICLTLEEGPGGLSPIDSFIVLLSAREVVTPLQLRQTLVCKFLLAILGLQNKTNDPAKGGNKVFPRLCPKSPRMFVVVQQKICHYEAWLCCLSRLTSSMPSVPHDSLGHLWGLTWPPQVASSPASPLLLPACQLDVTFAKAGADKALYPLPHPSSQVSSTRTRLRVCILTCWLLLLARPP